MREVPARLRPCLPLAAVLFFFACGAEPVTRRHGRDAYPNYEALSAAHVEGRDFSREIYAKRAPVAVFAVHGGDIEPGTAVLARAIAGPDFSLYIFNGRLGENSARLHITSAHFNDPLAVAIATTAVFGVSVHAQMERGEWVCVGGVNKEAGRAAASVIRAAGFKAEFPCARLPGAGKNNIVNRPARGGVQLELTPRLLRRLERSPESMSRFAEGVRRAALAAAGSAARLKWFREMPGRGGPGRWGGWGRPCFGGGAGGAG